MTADFRWNAWNLEHVTIHGVTVDEAESVVRNARPPYPEAIGDGKLRVYGAGQGDRIVHVIFVRDVDGDSVYVIHARPVVKDVEKRRVRRRKRR